MEIKNKLLKLIENKIYILIEEEEVKNKYIIEVNLDKIKEEIYSFIKNIKDIDNINIYIKVIDKYLI